MDNYRWWHKMAPNLGRLILLCRQCQYYSNRVMTCYAVCSFPIGDCSLLPIVHSSVEELAYYFVSALAVFRHQNEKYLCNIIPHNRVVD